MKDILKYIPGFRTEKKWKKIVAIIYYLFCLFILIDGISSFLIVASIPIIIFAIASFGKHINKTAVLTLIVGIIIFSMGVKLDDSTSKNKTANATTQVISNKVVSQKKEKTSIEIKKESDEKEKAADDAKIKLEDSKKTNAAEKTKLNANSKGELKVHYIDVGQADSILLQQGSNSMLIDAGNNPDSNLIKKYITDQGITKLNFVVGTHPHEDHIGGLDYVINSFQVGKIYMPKRTATTKTFEDVINAIKNKGLKVTAPTPGESFKLGEATCTILAPNGSGYEDINNESIVIKVNFGSSSFLFTGDGEDISEKEMLSKGFDIKSDVLKIGHHGSASSTTQEFLEKVSPKYAVVSVGVDNSYGHPHKETMDRLKSKDISVYRTDESGTIIATSNGKDITFNAKPGSYAYNGTGASDNKTSISSTNVVNKASSTIVKPPVVNSSPEKKVITTQNKSVTVYITESGKKYHSDGCRYLKKSKISISLNNAKEGYEPCSVCGAPR